MASLADPECERDILATMLQGGEACYQALAVLTSADFARIEHEMIYAAIAGLVGQGREVSYPAVRLVLSEEYRPALDAVVEAGFASPALLSSWIERVLMLSRLRRLREACWDIADTLAEGVPEGDYLAQVSDRLSGILSGQTVRDVVIAPDRWPDGMYEEACRRRDDTERFGYLRWGMPELERVVALQRKDMMILAAETGRGKTNMALGLAFAVAVRSQKKPTLYINSEMGWEQIAFRLGAMGTGVSAHRMRTGMLSEHDLAALDRFRRECAGNRLWLTDAVGVLTPERVMALARQYRARGMELLVVDYIQRLFGGSRDKEEKEWQVLLGVVQALKSLAQELDIIVIVVAQLNPEGYLARARQMAQEADAMVTLHHVDDLPPEYRRKVPEGTTHLARVIKSRHGPDRQEMALRFSPEWLRFEEVGWLRGGR